MSGSASSAGSTAGAVERSGEAAVAAPARGSGRAAWVRLLLLAALIAGFAWWADVRSVWSAIAAIPPAAIAVAFLLACADRVMMGFKWRHLVRAAGAQMRLRDAVSAYYQSAFTSRVVPIAIGHDVFRGYLARAMGVPTGVLVGSMAVEKLLALLASVLLASLGTAYLVSSLDAELRVSILVALGVAALFAGGALAAALYAPLHRWGGRLLRRRLPLSAYSLLGRISSALLLYRNRAGTLAANLGLACLEQLIQFAKFFVLGIGLGVTLPLVPFLATIAVVIFARRLTGYFESWGLAEATSILLFALLGVDRESAVALALTNYAVTTLAVLPGGYLIYRGRGLRRHGTSTASAGRVGRGADEKGAD